MKNNNDYIFFTELFVQRTSQISPDPTRETAFACGFSNVSVLRMEDFMKKTVHIDGMCCEHCAKRVEDKLSTAKNVVSVDVKLKKKIAIIRSREQVSNEEVCELIKDAGYSVNKIEE